MGSRHNIVVILLLLPALAFAGEPLHDLQPFYLTQQLARSLLTRRYWPR